MDPTVAQPAMPQMPEAQPDPFGGLVQAIALGFAAGFGGKSVQDQIAETRRQSWEAWMRKQDVALRREEMDRRDRQFAMSLDMQRTQLEFSKAADERAAARAEASDKAAQGRFDMTFKADREDKRLAEAQRTQSEAGLAQVGVQTGVLPFDTLFATPQMLDAARGAKDSEAAQGRFEAERLDRANFQAEARKSDENKQAFEVWRTLRAENADVRNLDSQFRAQAVQLARDDMTAGRTTSFEGSVEEYLKLFGRAGAAAKSGSVDMREALEAVKSGDFSRLDELRTAADVPDEPRTESRPSGTLAPIGGAPFRDGARGSPPRSGILASEVESRTSAQGAARQKAARDFLTKLPTKDLREIKDAFERNGGDSSDDASVLAWVSSAMDTVGNDPAHRKQFGSGWSNEDIASGKAFAVLPRDYGDGSSVSYQPTPLSEKVVDMLKARAGTGAPASRPASRPSLEPGFVGAAESRPESLPSVADRKKADADALDGIYESLSSVRSKLNSEAEIARAVDSMVSAVERKQSDRRGKDAAISQSKRLTRLNDLDRTVESLLRSLDRTPQAQRGREASAAQRFDRTARELDRAENEAWENATGAEYEKRQQFLLAIRKKIREALKGK